MTTCEADPLSPTGYTGVTEYGIQSDGLAEPISVGPCTPDEPKAGQPSLPAQVLRAFKRVPLPEPHLSIQPPNGKTLVGLETIFSTEAEPFTKTLKLLGKGVTLSITPAEFTWRHGDDTEQSTDWPGKPWEQGSDIDDYITHVYEHTGTTKPSVQITWEAEYRVGNGPWQPVNGTVTRTSPASTLSIREGTPELVAP